MPRREPTATSEPGTDPVGRDHGRSARHGRGFVRIATHTAVAIAVTASAVLLAGCENANMLLRVTFVNHTDRDLRIYVSVDPQASVAAGDTVAATIGGGGGCESDVTAVTEDGRLVADSPDKLRQGDTWTIEQSDLVPAPDPSPTP